jgi:hypothetical protein
MSYAIDLMGQKFGKLTVVDRDTSKWYQNKRYRSVWKCQCECGNTSSVRSISLRQGVTKSCGCIAKQRIPGPQNSNFKGYKELPLSLWSQIQNRAVKIGVPVDVSIEFLWELYLKQNQLCALSGREIQFGSHQSIGLNPKGTASLDRIDSSKGYVKENVQWVHKDVNMMKQGYDQNYFLDTCKRIVNNLKLNE